ncbi:MAG TPA: UDP-N-acetylmuramate dehydrogenase [Gammaproteobacteria bacterium]
MDIIPDQDLQSMNTLAVPARAARYVRVSGEAALRRALEFAEEQQLPLLVLGGGSNVVLPERFAGLVVQVAIKGIEVIREDDEYAWIRAGAGEVWQDLVEFSLQRNYYGLENLSLIPGTVGAAPIQNIGAYGRELDSVFESLTAVGRDDLRQHAFDAAACAFRYRDSVFKHRLRDAMVITRVTLRLRKHGSLNISYAPLREALSEIPEDALTPRKVSDAVIAIRRSKLPDPARIPNAGSFFKNPVVSLEKLAELQRTWPDIVSYPFEEDTAKLAAGWLLEKAGWRGHRQDGVGMHAQQALVLVNPGHRSGERVLDYAARIREDIANRFGVALEREPVAYVSQTEREKRRT